MTNDGLTPWLFLDGCTQNAGASQPFDKLQEAMT